MQTRYGEGDLQKYADRVGVAYESLRQYERVASRFENGRRLPILTWSHHQVVASRADAEEWLERAEREGWSVAITPVLNWVIDKINGIIRAYNSIPVAPNVGTIGSIGSSGGGNLGPSPRGQGLDRFASGGIVPGPLGAPRLAVVHGGEEVRTPGQQMSEGGIGAAIVAAIERLERAVVEQGRILLAHAHPIEMDGRLVASATSAHIGADAFMRARGG